MVLGDAESILGLKNSQSIRKGPKNQNGHQSWLADYAQVIIPWVQQNKQF